MNQVKGTQRQVVVLRTGGNRFFEEALFVVRRETLRTRANEADMLIEANRILRESVPRTGRRRFPLARVGLFLLGGLIGAGIVLLAVFLRRGT